MVKQKTEGNLTKDEWNFIIYYVYEEDDAKSMENKIINIINKKIQENSPVLISELSHK